MYHSSYAPVLVVCKAPIIFNLQHVETVRCHFNIYIVKEKKQNPLT